MAMVEEILVREEKVVLMEVSDNVNDGLVRMRLGI